MPKELILMRIDLFLKFTKQFMLASSAIDYSSKAKAGTLSYYFLRNKNLAFNSVKDILLQQSILSVLPQPDKRRMNPAPPENRAIRTTVNRNKASVFATENKVDHEGTETIFGQIF